ncbi:toxin, partial [Roseomonas mucosa]|nr:toxin [Roseomonas mucosa]
LMPYPDLRKHLPPASIPDMNALSALAQRYRVSLLALIYRWLSYTERRALLVISRDGFIWRSRSSEAALRSGAFFRAAAETIELPAASLAARQDMVLDNRAGVLHPPGVWFQEEAKEMAIFSEQYEMTISLLLLGDAPERRWHSDDEDPVAVAVDRWMR